MVIGALLAAAFLAIFTLAESFPARALFFIGAMVVAGTGYSLYLASVPPAVMEAEPGRRAAAFSVMNIAMVAGQSLARPVRVRCQRYLKLVS